MNIAQFSALKELQKVSLSLCFSSIRTTSFDLTKKLRIIFTNLEFSNPPKSSFLLTIGALHLIMEMTTVLYTIY